MAIFSSTIIPTAGRTKLARAVQSVLDQQLPGSELEVIVVNDSGQPLPAADWQRDARVQIIHTNRRERCVARNAGAAIARGAYLHFLDDDDWLLPDGLARLRALAEANPHTAWLYGATDLYDRHGNKVIELHNQLQGNCFVHVMAGEWIPMASSLLSQQVFFAAGGFNHHSLYSEDIDLARRVLLRHDLAYTPERIGCMEMGQEVTSTLAIEQRRNSRWTREVLLAEAESLPRMRQGATSAYLRGRIARIYLTSAVWNMQRRRWDTSALRLAVGCIQFIAAGIDLFRSDYWRALLKKYENRSFNRGYAASGRGGHADT